MPQGIAQKLADHEHRIVYGGREDSPLLQLSAQALARDGDAGRRVRKQDDARRTHLPDPRDEHSSTTEMPRSMAMETGHQLQLVHIGQ
ncbi:hypothetical protein Ssi02_60690 [Sinosporangium siamense]|uniref:Uncharacterized protein n=1 Tax=Sinosporangium siamense TaxID=1367973 RepID=A0A919V9W8_9ACTN|nr:hypothetical protein Ssi02_60690 [Sinosporangium siamense]